MKKEATKKKSRWCKNAYETGIYRYLLNDLDVAAIFPKETRDGRIVWGYFVRRIGSRKEVNMSNYTLAPIKLEPHYVKKRDAKKAVESLVEALTCR